MARSYQILLGGVVVASSFPYVIPPGADPKALRVREIVSGPGGLASALSASYGPITPAGTILAEDGLGLLTESGQPIAVE